MLGRPLKPEKAFQPLAIEADHDLPIDHRDGRAVDAERLQLPEGRFILADVALLKTHSVLTKELLRSGAEDSPRLRIHHHLISHVTSPRKAEESRTVPGSNAGKHRSPTRSQIR